MKIISSYIQAINTLGYQDFNSNKTYFKLPYTVECAVNDGILIYNLLTRMIVLLSTDEYINLSEKAYEWLVRHWFFIPEDLDPKTVVYMFNKIYASKFPRNKYGKLDNSMIYTTTYCNAQCPYCYETGIKKTHMTDMIAHDVGEYLATHCSDKITLRWFGGEPLCNPSAIDIICNVLKNKGVSYTSQITSNGLLFNQFDKAKLIDLWKVKKVQITLDGTEDNYNNIKNYQCDINAYKQVLSNIQYLTELGIYVTIRLNLSIDNYNDLYRLIDELKDGFCDNNRVIIYTSMLFNGEGSDPVYYSDEQKSILFKQLESLDYHINECGLYLRHSKPKVIRHHCMADGGRSNVILPNGDLTLCPHSFNEPYGSIYSDAYSQSILNSYFAIEEENSRCSTCFYYPQCIRLKKCTAKHECNKDFINYQKHKILLLMQGLYEKEKKEI